MSGHHLHHVEPSKNNNRLVIYKLQVHAASITLAAAPRLHALAARLFHIMLKKLPIMLFSHAPKSCLFCY